MSKTVDLQPWLDYFSMLRTYEDRGFLEIKTSSHEAYVMLSALHAMSEGNDPKEQIKKAVPDTLCRIRVYAAFRSQQTDYMEKPFAITVVKDSHPHDPLYTTVIARRRKWWALWRKRDVIKIVYY